MIRLLLAGALVLSSSGPAVSVDRSVGDPRITESSGLAVSPSQSSVLWTHNDSGNPPLVFALGRSGQVAATVRIEGVPDVDWEAMAAFRDSTGRALLAAADIGDNLAQRTSVEVDVVPEPTPRQDTTATPVLRLLLRYPDGPRDAETLLVDPARRRMFVLSKGLFSSTAYAVPASAWDGTAPLRPAVRSATLVPVGRVPLSLVTDGTVATDGAVLLRTYGELAVLGPLPVDPPPSGRGTATLTPRATVSLPSQRQGEGLALTPDGGSVLLSSEGVGQPVLRFALPTDVRAALSGAAAPPSSAPPSSAPPASEPSGRSSPTWAARLENAALVGVGAAAAGAALAALVVLVVAGVRRAARRRGRRSA